MLSKLYSALHLGLGVEPAYGPMNSIFGFNQLIINNQKINVSFKIVFFRAGNAKQIITNLKSLHIKDFEFKTLFYQPKICTK